MNLVAIKNKFGAFLRSFDSTDIKLLMQYIELALSEYHENAPLFLCKCFANHAFSVPQNTQLHFKFFFKYRKASFKTEPSASPVSTTTCGKSKSMDFTTKGCVTVRYLSRLQSSTFLLTFAEFSNASRMSLCTWIDSRGRQTPVPSRRGLQARRSRNSTAYANRKRQTWAFCIETRRCCTRFSRDESNRDRLCARISTSRHRRIDTSGQLIAYGCNIVRRCIGASQT